MMVEKKYFGLSIVYLFIHFGLFIAEAVLRAAGLTASGWPNLIGAAA
jgi:hypothetical protein